jgi:hypothetical protein
VRHHPRGIPPAQCAATAKGTGRRCLQHAMIGTTVCLVHGGKADQVLEKAGRNVIAAQLEDAIPRRSRTEQLADARHIAWVWTLDRHNRAARAVLAGEDPNPDDVRDAQLGARNVARIGKLEADIGVDEALVRNQELEGRLLVLVLDAIIQGLTASLAPVDRDALQLWMRTVARDRLLALDPQSLDEAEAVQVEPMAPPFRLAIAPAIEGEDVPSSNPAAMRSPSGTGNRCHHWVEYEIPVVGDDVQEGCRRAAYCDRPVGDDGVCTAGHASSVETRRFVKVERVDAGGLGEDSDPAVEDELARLRAERDRLTRLARERGIDVSPPA